LADLFHLKGPEKKGNFRFHDSEGKEKKGREGVVVRIPHYLPEGKKRGGEKDNVYDCFVRIKNERKKRGRKEGAERSSTFFQKTRGGRPKETKKKKGRERKHN